MLLIDISLASHCFVLALELFFCKLKANQVLHGIMLSGISANDVSVLAMSTADIDQVSIEIRGQDQL